MSEHPDIPPAAVSAPAKPLVSFRRRYGRRIDDNTSESRIWMTTFTDIMGLMLTFFVMMYAMSYPKIEEWKGLTDTIQENFNKYHEAPPANRGTNESITIDKIDFSQALNLNYLRALMETLLEREGMPQGVALINQQDSLIVSMPQDLLFAPSKADVKEEGAKALYSVANILSRIRNRVEIVGHADPRPIATEEFPSNWDLSVARAAHVAAVLESAGYSRDITIRGSAAGRYADLPKGLSETQRLDLSRRVDIVIMEDDGKRVKLFEIGTP